MWPVQQPLQTLSRMAARAVNLAGTLFQQNRQHFLPSGQQVVSNELRTPPLKTYTSIYTSTHKHLHLSRQQLLGRSGIVVVLAQAQKQRLDPQHTSFAHPVEKGD